MTLPVREGESETPDQNIITDMEPEETIDQVEGEEEILKLAKQEVEEEVAEVKKLAKDNFDLKSDLFGKKKRPVLKSKSFGYRHARHMRSYRMIKNDTKEKLSVRDQQSFQTTPQTDIAGCNTEISSADCRVHQKYRKIDGSCNNMKRPQWGQAEQPYRRVLPRKHSLVDCGNAVLSALPNVRLASRLLMTRSETDVSKSLSMYVMIWGQLIDHDMMMTQVRSTPEGDFLDCCDPENFDSGDCCPIKVPVGDFFYGKKDRPNCLPFLRSKVTTFPGNCKNRLLPDIENSNTAWLDLSHIYGSNKQTMESVREGKGQAFWILE